MSGCVLDIPSRGRNKYVRIVFRGWERVLIVGLQVKKFPDRNRKVPSRKVRCAVLEDIIPC